MEAAVPAVFRNVLIQNGIEATIPLLTGVLTWQSLNCDVLPAPRVKHQGPQVLTLTVTEEQTGSRVQVVLQDNQILLSFLPL